MLMSMSKMNKYINYKYPYYYLRYKKNNRIIAKNISFYSLYKYIKDNKLDTNKILFSCSFYELCRDYITFESERF